MSLFKGIKVLDAVTHQDVIDLTGTSVDDYNFNSEDTEKELKKLLEIWIERIASHIHTRIGKEVAEDDSDFLAIQDIVIRTVAKLVAVAQQQRTSPIVQLNDFAISVLNTSDVTKDLAKELRPFQKGGISIFSSIESYEGGE